jgi:endonuclease G, mitochondrial
MSIPFRLATALLLLVASTSSNAAFDACLDDFPDRTPPSVASNSAPHKLVPICFNDFAVEYSGESKTPLFAVERLNRAKILQAHHQARTDYFYEEARLPFSYRAHLEDYHGSGYDRGHMAPAGDMPTPEAMAQSFSLANMTPQVPMVNRGIWARAVEDATRKYAMRARGNVFVFTGAHFPSHPDTIGARHVWVPDVLYKLVYDATQNRAWAYWVDNCDGSRMRRPITYQELVNRTGISFLPNITPVSGSGATTTVATPATSPAPARPMSCGSKHTCKAMANCAEAKHYLVDCGVRSLDRDGDGVPCESLCR